MSFVTELPKTQDIQQPCRDRNQHKEYHRRKADFMSEIYG